MMRLELTEPYSVIAIGSSLTTDIRFRLCFSTIDLEWFIFGVKLNLNPTPSILFEYIAEVIVVFYGFRRFDFMIDSLNTIGLPQDILRGRGVIGGLSAKIYSWATEADFLGNRLNSSTVIMLT